MTCVTSSHHWSNNPILSYCGRSTAYVLLTACPFGWSVSGYSLRCNTG